MSWLLVYDKVPVGPRRIPEKLGNHLCPYDLPVLAEKLTDKLTLYYNRFSSFGQNQLLTPAGHNYEGNAAWSCLIFSKTEIKIQTDPLSQCPVWYFENESLVGISLEMKALQCFLGPVRMTRLAQGHQLVLNLQDGNVSVHGETRLPWSDFQVHMKLSLETAQDLLFESLKESAAAIPAKDLASFLSGGIDSSVATALLSGGISSTYNLVTDLGNEKIQSEETSRFLNLESQAIYFKQAEVDQNLREVVFQNELEDGLTAETLLQMNKLASETEQANIVTGYGADLLFGGMLRHKAYLEATGTHDTVSLIKRTYWSREFSPFYYWSKRKRLFHLFWHPAVISTALTIPLELQYFKAYDKYVLRSMAIRKNLLADQLAFRPKMGMTNGTQVNVMLSKLMHLPQENCYSEKTKWVGDLHKGQFTK